MASASAQRNLELADLVTRREFDSLSQTVAELARSNAASFRHIEEKLDRIGGTDFKTIFSGLSLACTVLLAVGGLIAFGLNAKTDAVEAIAQRADDAVREMAPTRWTREDEARAAAVAKAATDRRFQLMDDALQRQMRMLLDGPLERVGRLETQVERITDKVEEHQRDGHPGAVIQRVGALARVVEILHGSGDVQPPTRPEWRQTETAQ